MLATFISRRSIVPERLRRNQPNSPRIFGAGLLNRLRRLRAAARYVLKELLKSRRGTCFVVCFRAGAHDLNCAHPGLGGANWPLFLGTFSYETPWRLTHNGTKPTGTAIGLFARPKQHARETQLRRKPLTVVLGASVVGGQVGSTSAWSHRSDVGLAGVIVRRRWVHVEP